MSTPLPHSPDIGRRLKALRRRGGLSLDATARQTGTSKAMLGQIERGESSPTIATLWKIATGLDVALSYFLVAATDDDARPTRRPIPGPWHEDAAGMRTRPVFTFDAALGFEMFEVQFIPGAYSASEPHAIGSVEQILVHAGNLVIEIADERYCLGPGDALRFAGDQHHSYHNEGDTIVRAQDLIHYPR